MGDTDAAHEVIQESANRSSTHQYLYDRCQGCGNPHNPQIACWLICSVCQKRHDHGWCMQLSQSSPYPAAPRVDTFYYDPYYRPWYYGNSIIYLIMKYILTRLVATPTPQYSMAPYNSWYPVTPIPPSITSVYQPMQYPSYYTSPATPYSFQTYQSCLSAPYPQGLPSLPSFNVATASVPSYFTASMYPAMTDNSSGFILPDMTSPQNRQGAAGPDTRPTNQVQIQLRVQQGGKSGGSQSTSIAAGVRKSTKRPRKRRPRYHARAVTERKKAQADNAAKEQVEMGQQSTGKAEIKDEDDIKSMDHIKKEASPQIKLEPTG